MQTGGRNDHAGSSDRSLLVRMTCSPLCSRVWTNSAGGTGQLKHLTHIQVGTGHAGADGLTGGIRLSSGSSFFSSVLYR